MDLFDTHVHLGDAQFAADRAEVLERALEKGVRQLVEIADSPDDWAAALALSRARPQQVRCSLGLHPYYADRFTEGLLEELAAKVKLPEVVAVGEIGLDYVKAQVPKEVQLASFERLLSACRGWDKPVVVHCRGAYEDLIPALRKVYPEPPKDHRFWGVVHCFSGTPEEAMLCAGLGFALGADGPVTYPKNEPLRQAFLGAGLEKTVLETDCPYLPPQSSRGKRNEPTAVLEIAARLAAVFGVTQEEVARRTRDNARALYRYP